MYLLCVIGNHLLFMSQVGTEEKYLSEQRFLFPYLMHYRMGSYNHGKSGGKLEILREIRENQGKSEKIFYCLETSIFS